MCIRAALNRYFKDKHEIDVISNDKFIQANEAFKAVTNKGKSEGRGEIVHKMPVEDEDMKTLSVYFRRNMVGEPNAIFLQELVLFSVIYFGGRRGRENLLRALFH